MRLALLLTGGWLKSGDAETQPCAASHGDRTQTHVDDDRDVQ
jgi:hypothetical protein